MGAFTGVVPVGGGTPDEKKSSRTVQYLNEALQVKRSAVQGWWSVYDDVH